MGIIYKNAGPAFIRMGQKRKTGIKKENVSVQR